MNRGLHTAVSKMDVSPTEVFLAEYDYASAVPALSTAPSLGAPQMCQATPTTQSILLRQSRETAVGMPTAVVLSKYCSMCI